MAERSGPLALGFGDDLAGSVAGTAAEAGRGRGGGAVRAARTGPAPEAAAPEPPDPAPPAATGPAFEAAMAELERIVRDLESGDLGLDAALGLYERGVALIRLCAGQLDRAEARLQALTIDEAGRPALTPVEEPGA